MDFIIGGLAGAGASGFTNPMDVIKTRLQLQGELKSLSKTETKYRGSFHAIYVIVKKDGLKALQTGLAPSLALGFVLNALRLGIYHIAEVHGWTKNKNGDVSIEKAIFWSGVGGLLGGICCNPLLVIRTRLQSMAHPSIAVGRQHQYNGLCDGLIKIYKYEGIKGYAAGISVTGSRIGIGSAAQLTTFSKAKEILISHGICKSSPIALAFAASAMSGVVIVLTVCPIDVAAVRMYNQGSLRTKRQTIIHRITRLHYQDIQNRRSERIVQRDWTSVPKTRSSNNNFSRHLGCSKQYSTTQENDLNQ